jgi:hypothetical protein
MPLPIVGAHFRLNPSPDSRWPATPAKALLSALPSATPLYAVGEPTNPFDSTAVAVVLKSADIPPALRDTLDLYCQPYGFSADSIYEASEHQLGYVPRGLASHIFPRLSGAELKGELCFDLAGKPCLRLPKEVEQVLDSVS